MTRYAAGKLLPPTEKPLRIALVIAGAVSLGSYEAGALTALLQLLRRSEGEVLVDTIVGASAGSITGLLLAHTLLTGSDQDAERTLWVEKTDLALLLRGGTQPGRPRGPLSSGALEEWAGKVLSRRPSPDHPPIQDEPIYLVLSLANLQGLTYWMSMRGREEPVRADTYRDAASFSLDSDSSSSEWEDAMRSAVASSAHAFAFSAAKLSRKRSDYPPEVDLPEGTTEFWYTDGGTVYNEPFGMAIDAVYSPQDVGLLPRVQKDDDRLFLLIHPHPDDPRTKWPPGGGDPVFGQSSLRAFNMQRAQSLYQDLHTLEKYNSRLYWRQRLQDALGKEGLDESQRMRNLAEEAQRERAYRRRKTKGTSEDGTAPLEADAGPSKSPVEAVLDAATGTTGKRPAWVEVVSPEVDPRAQAGTPIGELLAGERLGHFLGFADERARRSDFRLGYQNFQQWWQGDGDGFRMTVDLPGLEVPDRGWRGWDEFGKFKLSDVRFTKRLVWGFRLLVRYYRELRALRKALHKGP